MRHAGRQPARLALIAATLALAALAVAAAGPEPTLRLAVSGPPRVIYDQAKDACDNSDLPDAPARAFRDAAGQLVLFAPNYRNRAFVGPDLAGLIHDCAIRFAAGGNPDPAMLDDRSWLHAFHTTDGRNVFAFASASFIPYRHKQTCAAGEERTDCWINGIAAVESTDGGRTFRYLGDPPGHIAFPPPSPWRNDVADPPGFITATNFVTWQGALYTILSRRGAPGEGTRNCLARAPALDTRRWEVWSGSGFVPATSFDGGRWQAATTDCARIGPANLPPIRGLVFNEKRQIFVAVFQYRTGRGAAAEHGFFYATSKDMIAWSAPKLLLATDLLTDAAPGEPWAAYPSIMDEASTDRDFGTIGDSANLIFVRVFTDPTTQRATRSLMAIPISVTGQ